MGKLDMQQIIQNSYDEESEGLKMLNNSSLVPNSYDTIELSYTGDDITQVLYKQGASLVATLTLSYSGGKLTSVVKS